MIPTIIDNRIPTSLASRLRSKRNMWLKCLLDDLPLPFSILDVGGLPPIWERLGLAGRKGIQITLLNTSDHADQCRTSYSNMECVVGDARDMRQFKDKSFEVVYSNSVIEHVGGMDDIQQMASEIRRVGKRFFVQTPNRYFPIEPHFVFPIFQFLPFDLQVLLIQHLNLGWFRKTPNRAKAEAIARSIRLLSRRELAALFPEAEICGERFAGLVKSFVARKV